MHIHQRAQQNSTMKGPARYGAESNQGEEVLVHLIMAADVNNRPDMNKKTDLNKRPNVTGRTDMNKGTDANHRLAVNRTSKTHMHWNYE